MVKVDFVPRLRRDFPYPVVLVSCSLKGDRPNLIAVGSISHACHVPPILGIAIGHSRHSYRIISHSDGFVVNVPSKTQVGIVDSCGTTSGREIDKFKTCHLTPLPSSRISSPGILEFPINIECAKRKCVNLGSHSFFFGEIVAIHCDESILNDEGEIDKDRLQPLCRFSNGYWDLGEMVLKRIDTSKSAVISLARGGVDSD